MAITEDIARELLAFLFPPVCLACQRAEGLESLPMGLCEECRNKLRPLHRFSSQNLRSGPSALEGVISGWLYEPPFESVIHALKFSRMEFLGPHLATGLHDLYDGSIQEVDMVVPVPLHWYRLSRRGYNQAEAIARPLARLIDRPLVRALRRTRFTRPQAQLGRRERESNLRLAFASSRNRQAQVAQRSVLLVDDVVTTGATLEAAATVLRKAGAESVMGITAGRASRRLE